MSVSRPPSELPASLRPWIGRVVGRYRIESLLGTGSIGAVFRATDDTLGRAAAVRIVDAGDPVVRARLLRDARTSAGLQHPALLTVLDVAEADGFVLVFSELMPRGTLAAWSAAHGPADPAHAAGVAAAVARGLGFAHKRGVTHRDVKPSNVYLGEGGLVKLGDFGLARTLEETRRLTRGRLAADRLQYAAPELLHGSPATPASDVCSLGYVLYGLIAGRPPFAETALSALLSAKQHPPADLRRLRPEVPAALAEAVARAAAPDPSARFASADEFADALKSALGRPASSPPASAPRSASAPRPTRPPPVAAEPPAAFAEPRAAFAEADDADAHEAGPSDRLAPAGIAQAETRRLPEPESSGGEPSSSPGSPASPMAGKRVGGYEILSELGRGGMGVVYKARDVKLKRIVALKMILSGGHAGRDAVDRFRREAEAVARLNHPNIVAIHEVGEADGLPFFALEYLAGGSLASRIAGAPQPPRPAAQTMAVLAEAVHAAHSAGIVHRDLKPANVLFSADGAPKVTDFGLAKQMDSAGPTASGEVMGTPAYMAPEQLDGSRRVGPAADIYALGALLYDMLAGRPPFLGETEVNTIWMLMTQDPVPLRVLQPKVPADLETICIKCLNKDPRKRYGSASELGEDLCFTVLRLAGDHPEETSEQLARRASDRTGRPLRAEAFRKQLSRARPLFRRLLTEEVAGTLSDPTPENLALELAELGLAVSGRPESRADAEALSDPPGPTEDAA